MAEEINIPISFEYLLSFLFGKHNYHGHCGFRPLATWKKEQLKLIKTIRKAVKINIDSDIYHCNGIIKTCDFAIQQIKDAKTKDAVNTAMIEYCVKIIFALLGNFPDNWDKKGTSNWQTWKLDSFRKLIYTSTVDNKANLILSLAESSKYGGKLPSDRDLFMKRIFEFAGDSEKFVNWFKYKYPEIYNDIS